MTTARSSFFTRHQVGQAIGVIGLTLLAFIVLGHDGRRLGQLALLAMPALLLLAWPLRSAWAHGLRTSVVWILAMAFVLDGVLRAYLQQAYQAAPDSTLVLGAVANTNSREGSEYLAMYWRPMLGWAAAVLVALWLVTRYAGKGARRIEHGALNLNLARPRVSHVSRWGVGLLCIVLLLVAAAYASKPWRRLHPLVYWPQWSQSVQVLRASWDDQQNIRDQVLLHAQAQQPTVAFTGPATVVLVITDSLNRDNMSVYGYERPTTPLLAAQKAQLGSQMRVLKNAWSVDASTLPSLRNMFLFGEGQTSKPQDALHAIALARAAGYKTYWISNHDDMAIEQQHGRLADVVDMVNRTPGRASASLDSELLDCVLEALQDPTERKLVVVHLMGAHPHYSLRFPKGNNPFTGPEDAVDAELENDGRSAWVRKSRREYDAAVLYHDSVVANLFKMTQETGKPEDYRAWMYLSDHGQEVGHDSNHAGHSPSTAAGYSIPTIIWRNQPQGVPTGQTEDEPFRADWMAWTLSDLLHIRWPGNNLARSVLQDGYQWQAPVLPAPVKSFNE